MGNKELKTLKDIFCQPHKCSNKDYEKRIRQEAIKWVKALETQIALQKTTPIIKKLMDETMGVKEMKDGAIEFICGFFNITEEELKQEKNNGK